MLVQKAKDVRVAIQLMVCLKAVQARRYTNFVSFLCTAIIFELAATRSESVDNFTFVTTIVNCLR